jgi:hypothetical protein
MKIQISEQGSTNRELPRQGELWYIHTKKWNNPGSLEEIFQRTKDSDQTMTRFTGSVTLSNEE